MRAGLVTIAIAAGCGFSHGSVPNVPVDGSVDAPPDMPEEEQVCFGNSPFSLFTVCYGQSQVPTAPINATIDAKYDTTACAAPGRVVTSKGIESCLVAGGRIEITASFTVTGTRPLVILATTDLLVAQSGIVDASSPKTRNGPNANASTCNPQGAGGAATSGGGGGAGGSFATAGGSGGAGGSSTSTIGVAANAPSPMTLVGGCAGSRGGEGNAMNAGGDGGASGGAVYLLAANTIVIAGKVYASGAGGRGGHATAGGGGGGSGGLIGFEAPVVTIASGTSVQPVIATNGGAGGGGGTSAPGGDGGDGTLVSTPGAYGGAPGAGTPLAGEGGVGTNWDDIMGGTGGSAQAGSGGGGGGGGYGIIWVVGTYSNVNGDVSPMTPVMH